MAKNRNRRRRKGKSPMGRQQQTQSFEQYMLNQTLNKFRGYIDAEINAQAQQIANQQKNLLENLYTRIRVLEDLAMENFKKVTKEVLAERIASVEDETARPFKFEAVDVVSIGDRVRMEIATKSKDKEEYAGKSKIMLDDTGSGRTLGKELESALIGMKTGEVKEIEFGRDKTMLAQLTVNRVSSNKKTKEEAERQQKEAQEKAKAAAEAKAKAEAEAKAKSVESPSAEMTPEVLENAAQQEVSNTEGPNADSNAG